uniref:AP2/ERF domain-containing protein n=1 Tax=Musa acuminata subsp. malaccensis TaxID=214687 RepID=A0A804J0U4_MUSAM|nr:PREDICTED: AP2-like ethylene-responsive transcription factor At1g79700 isoform X1 [Musa acuminata subsp. malaccensis]
MGKIQKNNSGNQKNVDKNDSSSSMKMKRTRRSVPRDSPSQRSSVFRGVTRHRWTGRYEAHLWDKNCWNESQNKKGKQVYLGAYDDEEAAAHAYDLAALKYWGHDTILNFPTSAYQEELKDMENQSREEYIGSLRRKSSGFSRGVSKYRGVARHHHNGRWEARIGRVSGNKYLYLGTYATQEEAATAYDIAAIEYRGLNAVTNFDLSRYIKWLQPKGLDAEPGSHGGAAQSMQQQDGISVRGISQFPEPREAGVATSSALDLLLQSSKFKEMLEKTSAESSSTSSTPGCDDKPTGCSFPDYIQTYFECQDNGGFIEEEDSIFGDLSTLISPITEFELDI